MSSLNSGRMKDSTAMAVAGALVGSLVTTLLFLQRENAMRRQLTSAERPLSLTETSKPATTTAAAATAASEVISGEDTSAPTNRSLVAGLPGEGGLREADIPETVRIQSYKKTDSTLSMGMSVLSDGFEPSRNESARPEVSMIKEDAAAESEEAAAIDKEASQAAVDIGVAENENPLSNDRKNNSLKVETPVIESSHVESAVSDASQQQAGAPLVVESDPVSSAETPQDDVLPAPSMDETSTQIQDNTTTAKADSPDDVPTTVAGTPVQDGVEQSDTKPTDSTEPATDKPTPLISETGLSNGLNDNPSSVHILEKRNSIVSNLNEDDFEEANEEMTESFQDTQQMEPVYLDYNGTTPVDPAVLDALLPYLRRSFGNPSSSHCLGREAKLAMDEARKNILTLLGRSEQDPSSIWFTSCGEY
jgi:Aminotransferase class-V